MCELTHQNPKTGIMRITQEKLDQTDLVLLADQTGVVEYSAINRDKGQVIRMLRDTADAMEKGTI